MPLFKKSGGTDGDNGATANGDAVADEPVVSDDQVVTDDAAVVEEAPSEEKPKKRGFGRKKKDEEEAPPPPAEAETVVEAAPEPVVAEAPAEKKSRFGRKKKDEEETPPPPAEADVVTEAAPEPEAPKEEKKSRFGRRKKEEAPAEADLPLPEADLPPPVETAAETVEAPPPEGAPQPATAEVAADDSLLPKEEVAQTAAKDEGAEVVTEAEPVAEAEEEAPAEEEGKKAKKKGKKEKGAKPKKAKALYQAEPYDTEKHGALAIFEGVPDYEEVERYWLEKPYSFAVILYNDALNHRTYHVVEPKLTPFEETFLTEMKSRLRDVLMMTEVEQGQEKRKEEVIIRHYNEILADYNMKVEVPTYYKVLYYILRDFVKLEKLTALMSDKNLEDVSCNGWNMGIFLFHKNYQNIQTNVVFTPQSLTSFVIRLAQGAGKHISVSNPMVDATMPDGSRIQMTLGDEITTKGCTFTIRKFKDVPTTPIDLIKWNTFSSQMVAYLWLCIENGKSLIFSGGTASGKTTALNGVSLFIPPMTKVISLEDTREIQLPHPNWIPGKTRDSFTPDGQGAVDMYELLRAALRQRPEYLIVGEVRGKEALTLFQAMSTGHTTYSTMHADSIDRVIHRLENPPISVPRTMIEALDCVSIQAQTYTAQGKRVRRCLSLTELAEIDPVTKILKTVDVYKWDPNTDTFPEVGISIAMEAIRKRRAWSPQELQRQLRNRQRVLDYMVEKNITGFPEVAKMIHLFQVRPDRCLKLCGLDGGTGT